MRFTVTWHPAAQSELARIWLDSENRQVIARAADQIDRELSKAPDQKGEEFYGDRILIVRPLAVTFALFPADQRVDVLQVWHE